MWWRPKARVFEVLGERFVLPRLRLGPQLERGARTRRRLGATWFESVTDPVVRPFRSPATRVQIGFLRAHRVLSVHEQIVLTALDHVAVYDDALARATSHVGERARLKIDALLALAAERRRVAERAAHLATRVESQLERDLAVLAERVRAVGKAAHLMLVRLGRYRAFVQRNLAALVHRESQLTSQRTLLVHDEHAWIFERELNSDLDFTAWKSAPDALCAGIEASLQGLVRDLDGLEMGLVAVPATVERLFEQADLADPSRLDDALRDLDDGLIDRLPGQADLPARLDDGDWDALERHEFESEIVFKSATVEALGSEVMHWLAAHGSAKGSRARRCATCPNAIVSGATLGRAHVLCVSCRARAAREGEAWLRAVGFRPVPRGRGLVTGPITRVVFESVMGWVPRSGRADEPVTDVSWHDAVAFCNAMSKREGRARAYHRGRKGTKWVLGGKGPTGWRLPDRAPEELLPDLREWLWAGGDDAQDARRLGNGLRQIVGAQAADRAPAEAREPDVGFRIMCDRAAPEPGPPAQREHVPPPLREHVPPPPVPVAPRRARKPAVSAEGRRRRRQAASLIVLVSLAAFAIAHDRGAFDPAPLGGARPTADDSTAPETPTHTIEPAPAPEGAAGDEPEEADAKREMDLGFSARASKDRKAARASFERVLARAPGNLAARYEAAREAAHARDVAAAFAHLDALVADRGENPTAKELLGQALLEPDFARIKRDPRWKLVEAAADR